MKPSNNENKLIGQWVFKDGEVRRDEGAARIQWLISSYLMKIATDGSGWSTLYQDPGDKRLWELTYPHGEMQGGGPPSLTHLSEEEAKNKYNW
jgi:Immunity protein 27